MQLSLARLHGVLNCIVTSVGAPRTVELLEKAGIKVDVLDLSELNKGRGSVHCLTAFLKRDEQ